MKIFSKDRLSPRVRTLPIAFALVSLVACTGGVSQNFDSASHLRSQIAEHVGRQAAADIEVPFHLDETVLEAVDSKIKPVGDDRSRVARILDFVFTGLDLEYALAPTRNASQTFIDRAGNCLSFVNLFVGVARHLRLSPFYVEVTDYQRWDHREGMVVSQGHIVAGLYVRGELRTYDFLPYRVKAYKDFKPIDDLTAAAHFYNNLGAEALLDGRLEEAHRFLTIAGEIDPAFVKGINNLGVYYARVGQLDRAIELYRRGLEAEPEDVPLLTNLARAFQQSGHVGQAEEVLSRVEGMHHTNPFFFVYKGEVALSRGDNTEALEYMRRALSRDTDFPEVHVGLVKVYIALGEIEKARHHVGRALKLDATHSEARRYATMLESM